MRIRSAICSLILAALPTFLYAQSAAVINANADGNAAFAARQYETAIRKYQQALNLAVEAGDKQYEAIATFGMARTYGQLCEVDQAERAFWKSISLRESLPDQKYAYLSQNLLEFARFLIAQKRVHDAVPLIDRAIPLLEKLEVAKSDPIAYADFLDEYQSALKAVGRGSEAADTATKAASLRQANPGRSARFKPDQYPTACSR
jgi:tetratricopeptide (TPR) repeat protein